MSNSLVTSVSPEDLAAIAPGQAHAGIAKALGYAGKSDVQQMYVDFELFAKNALLRNAHIAEYGFVLLTLECLDALASRLHELTCLEVGAGTGYLSYHLAQRNINVTASEQFVEANRYGFRKLWKNDHEGNSLVLLPGNYDVVLMSWPPSTGNFACEVLTSMSTGQVLVYQGEEQGGRTGTDEMHELLVDENQWEPLYSWSEDINKFHLQFSGIHDTWKVFRKR